MPSDGYFPSKFVVDRTELEQRRTGEKDILTLRKDQQKIWVYLDWRGCVGEHPEVFESEDRWIQILHEGIQGPRPIKSQQGVNEIGSWLE